jgi:hypothetical protein
VDRPTIEGTLAACAGGASETISEDAELIEATKMGPSICWNFEVGKNH